MSPEHAAELKKRGIVYTPWPPASKEPKGHPCRDACGARVGWPNERCGRCKIAKADRAVADREERSRTHKREKRAGVCRCAYPSAKKIDGKCNACYLREWRAEQKVNGKMRITKTKKLAA